VTECLARSQRDQISCWLSGDREALGNLFFEKVLFDRGLVPKIELSPGRQGLNLKCELLLLCERRPT